MSGKRAKLFRKVQEFTGMNPRHLADAARSRPDDVKSMAYGRMRQTVEALRARREKRTEEEIAKEFLRQSIKGL